MNHEDEVEVPMPMMLRKMKSTQEVTHNTLALERIAHALERIAKALEEGHLG